MEQQNCRETGGETEGGEIGKADTRVSESKKQKTQSLSNEQWRPERTRPMSGKAQNIRNRSSGKEIAREIDWEYWRAKTKMGEMGNSRNDGKRQA